MPNQHNRDEQRANREEAGHADNPKENQEAQRVEKKTRRKAYISNQVFRWITLTVDVLVFAAVAIYSFFAYQQWQATVAAVRSADANARLDQRAWIASIGVTEGVPEEDKPFTIKVGIKNTGKTYGSHAEVRGCTRPVPRGAKPNFSDEAATKLTSVALLTPGGEYFISPNPDELANAGKVDKPLVDNLASGEVRLFVFGTITYQDIFKCKHWTSFCFFFEPRSKTYPAFTEHNDAGDCACGDDKAPCPPATK